MYEQDMITRAQVLLEQVKSGYVAGLGAMLAESEAAIRKVLRRVEVAGLGELGKRDLQRLLGDVRAAQVGLHTAYIGKQLAEFEKAAGYASELDAKILRRTNYRRKTGRAVSAVDAHKAYVAARNAPIPATGGLLEPFVKDWSAGTLAAVSNTIRVGWVNGATVQETTGEIVRTLGLKRSQGAAMVRTATQHVASVARFETWHANNDLVRGYQWIATLDRRTTAQCRSLDGRKFSLGKGPKPPIHIQCRSTTIPVLDKEFDWLDEDATRASMDGPVPANETYYSWLKKQPADFQKQVLGSTRYKLFTDGGLDAKGFARLNLDKAYRPLTLAEMKAKEPLVFQKAGIPSAKPLPGAKPQPAAKLPPKPPKLETGLDPAPVVSHQQSTIHFEHPTSTEKFSAGSRDAAQLLHHRAKETRALVETVDLRKVKVAVFEDPDFALGSAVRDDYVLFGDTGQFTDVRRQKMLLVRRHGQLYAADVEAAQTLAYGRWDGVTKAKVRVIDSDALDKEWKAWLKKFDAAPETEKLNGQRYLAANKPTGNGDIALRQGNASTNMMFRIGNEKTYAEDILHADLAGGLGELRVNELPPSGRAFFQQADNSINISPSSNFSTVTHEILHALENKEEFKTASNAFLRYRGRGETPKKLSKLTGNKAYRADEVALEDKWAEGGGIYYSGKVYSYRLTEIYTTGGERLLNERLLRFRREDPEFFEFIVRAFLQM